MNNTVSRKDGDRTIINGVDEDGDPFEIINEPYDLNGAPDEMKANLQRSMIDVKLNKLWHSNDNNLNYGDDNQFSIPNEIWLIREMEFRNDTDLLLKQAIANKENDDYYSHRDPSEYPENDYFDDYFDDILSDDLAMHILYRIVTTENKDQALMIKIIEADILPKAYAENMNKLICDNAK